MKTEIRIAGVAGGVTLAMMFCLLAVFDSMRMALLWLLLASLLWFWVCRDVWQRLELNRKNAASPILTTLGLANRLTLLRGFLIALTGGFLLQPQAEGFIGWLPGIFYGVAATLDRVDGFVARKTRQTTLLGAELDTRFDALGLLVAPLLAVGFGKVHWSYLLLSGAFYIFQWGIKWRLQRNYPVLALTPSPLRRALAGFQMGFIAVVLLPCFQPTQTIICGFAFMLPALLVFVLDWLTVSAVLNTRAATTTRFFTALASLSAAILQPGLRVVVAVGVWLKIQILAQAPVDTGADTAVIGGLILGASLMLVGWAGRVGALMILILLNSYWVPAIQLPETPLAEKLVDILALCGAVWVLLLGTGRFSLWQWDDTWVNRQDGAEANR